MDTAQARKWILALWAASVAFATIRENLSGRGRPFPRPCVLVRITAAQTVFAIAAELLPRPVVLVDLGITVGAFLAPATQGGQSPIGVLNQAMSKLNGLTGGS